MKIKDAILEKYLADALPPDLKKHVEEVLASSPEDAARLAELRADSEAFLIQHPPSTLLARLENKPKGISWFRRGSLGLAISIAMASLVIWFKPEAQTDPDADFNIKGGLSWSLYGKLGSETVRLNSGATVPIGTSIRFEVSAPQKGYLAILGKDALGVVSVYYPYQGTRAAMFDPKSPLLPVAIELDATLGTEQFFAVFHSAEFELKPLVQKLGESDSLAGLPQSFSIAPHTLNKKP